MDDLSVTAKVLLQEYIEVVRQICDRPLHSISMDKSVYSLQVADALQRSVKLGEKVSVEQPSID